MSIKQVSARWTGEALNYIGIDSQGRQIKMGGEDGMSPSQLLLVALAGCTGMDVVSILQKKRQQVTEVEVQITGHQPDEYPKPYQVIEVAYIIKGNQLDPQAVARAIDLSVAKYCIVSQTLQQPVQLKTSFTLRSEP